MQSGHFKPAAMHILLVDSAFVILMRCTLCTSGPSMAAMPHTLLGVRESMTCFEKRFDHTELTVVVHAA